jgi:hypothetical protein
MDGKPRKAFAARMHLALVVAMLLSFLLIAQQRSKVGYKAGLALLIASALVQVVFGNVAPEAGFARSLKQLVLGLVVVAAVFGLGVLLTPVLVNLGR